MSSQTLPLKYSRLQTPLLLLSTGVGLWAVWMRMALSSPLLTSSFRTSSYFLVCNWLIFNHIFLRKIGLYFSLFSCFWILARHCIFNNRVIKHGYKLSDPLCTGIVSCYNGHLNMEYCPKIPEKPTDCARPKLKTINVPGKCCKKLWVCSGNWQYLIIERSFRNIIS